MKVSVISLLLSSSSAITLEQLQAIRTCPVALDADGNCPGQGFAEGAGCTCKKVTKAGVTKVVCKKGKTAKPAGCGCTCKKVGKAKKCKKGKMLGFTGKATLCGKGLSQTCPVALVDGECPSQGFHQTCPVALVDGECPSQGFHQTC